MSFWQVDPFTGLYALLALGAGKHLALDLAGLETHRAGVFTGRVTAGAVRGAMAVKTDHQRPGIGHPHQALEQAHGTAVATEQVTGKTEFNTQQQGGGRDKDKLVTCQLAVYQVAPYFGGGQQVGQEGDGPQQRETQYCQYDQYPRGFTGMNFRTVTLHFRQWLVLPERDFSAGAAHEAVDGFDDRKVRA